VPAGSVLQHLFNGVVARRFPDRRWSISAAGSGSIVARAVDGARFVSDDDLPPEVAEQRSDAYRDALQHRAAPDSVLHYSKQVTLDNDVLHEIDHSSRFVLNRTGIRKVTQVS
jgi:hypothetical protein